MLCEGAAWNLEDDEDLGRVAGSCIDGVPFGYTAGGLYYCTDEHLQTLPSALQVGCFMWHFSYPENLHFLFLITVASVSQPLLNFQTANHPEIALLHATFQQQCKIENEGKLIQNTDNLLFIFLNLSLTCLDWTFQLAVFLGAVRCRTYLVECCV